MIYLGEEFNEKSDEILTRPSKEKSEFSESTIALHKPTGVVSWGVDSKNAVQNLKNDVEKYHSSNEISKARVTKDNDILGGRPRIDGTRIGVDDILRMYDKTDSIVETAGVFSGVLTIQCVLSAIFWSEDNIDVLLQLEKEQIMFDKWVEENWTRKDYGFKNDLDDIDTTWEEFKQNRNISFDFL